MVIRILDAPQWAGSLGLAGASIGRLSAVLGSPIAAAWAFRARAQAASAIMEAVGHKVDPLRLQAWISGLPLRPSRDFGATNMALGVLNRLKVSSAVETESGEAHDDPEDIRDRREVARALATMERAAARPDYGPILGCAVGFLTHLADQGDRIGACIAVGQWFHAAGLLPMPAPTLTGATMFRNWSATDDFDQRIAWFLKALVREAQDSERDLIALQYRWRGWRRRLGPQRRDSRLTRTLDFTTARGIVGPATVARYLRVRTSVGTEMLEELVRLGCVVEATRRRSYRVFLAEDLAGLIDEIAPDAGAGSGGKVHSILETPDIEAPDPPPLIDLDRAMSDLDAILVRTRALGLGKHGSRD